MTQRRSRSGRAAGTAGVAIALLLTARAANAAPALDGLQGGFDCPTSERVPDGTMTLGLGYADAPVSYAWPTHQPYPNRYYDLTTQILPGLEVSARFTEVLGLYDPTIHLPNYIDRVLALRYALPMPACWPSVAVGNFDLFSINQVNGIDQPWFHAKPLEATYGVAGYDFGLWAVDLGYGVGTKYLTGPFGALRVKPGWGLTGVLEYANGSGNVGVEASLPWGFAAKLAWLHGAGLGVSTSYTYHM